MSLSLKFPTQEVVSQKHNIQEEEIGQGLDLAGVDDLTIPDQKSTHEPVIESAADLDQQLTDLEVSPVEKTEILADQQFDQGLGVSLVDQYPTQEVTVSNHKSQDEINDEQTSDSDDQTSICVNSDDGQEPEAISAEQQLTQASVHQQKVVCQEEHWFLTQ